MKPFMPLICALFGLGPMGLAIHISLRMSGAKMNAAEPYAFAFHMVATAAFLFVIALALCRRRQ